MVGIEQIGGKNIKRYTKASSIEEGEVKMHIQGLLEDKLPIPESKSFAEYVAVAEKSCMEQTA